MPDISWQELRALLAPTTAPVAAAQQEAQREIVVADRGWVFVGVATTAPDGSVQLRSLARAIRAGRVTVRGEA